jgi:hypothetical protein
MQKIKTTLTFIAIFALLAIVPGTVLADSITDNSQGQTGDVQKAIVCPSGEAHPTNDPTTCAPLKRAVNCPSGKVDSQDPTKCAALGNDCNGNSAQTCLKNSAFIKDLNNIVNFLSAAVAIVVIAMLIIGGIQYSLAGDNATAITAARQRITNALIALAAFIFSYAFLQWLIPGGI